LQERQNKGEILTGLLFVDESVSDMHEMSNTPDEPLATLSYEKLCPGSDALNKLQEEFR
jgi:2-oxoglutarate ferredoxin oxidoreductase subunit beta